MIPFDHTIWSNATSEIAQQHLHVELQFTQPIPDIIASNAPSNPGGNREGLND